jgi:hypothetical protein
MEDIPKVSREGKAPQIACFLRLICRTFNRIEIAYGEVALLGYARLWANGSL